MLWLQGLAGLPFLLGGLYLAWDILPYIRSGAGRIVLITLWGLTGGGLASGGLCVALLGRRRAGTWLRRSLLAATAGAGLLALPGFWFGSLVVSAIGAGNGWPDWARPAEAAEPFVAMVATWTQLLLAAGGGVVLAVGRQGFRLLPARPGLGDRYPVWPLVVFAGSAPAALALASVGWGALPTDELRCPNDRIGRASVAEWLEELTMPGSRAEAAAELEALGLRAQPVFEALAQVGAREGASRRREVCFALAQATRPSDAAGDATLWRLFGSDAGDWLVPELDHCGLWQVTAVLGLDAIEARGASAVNAVIATSGSNTSRLGRSPIGVRVLRANAEAAVPLIRAGALAAPDQRPWVRLAALALSSESQRPQLVALLAELAASDDESLRWDASRRLALLGEAGSEALADLLLRADGDAVAYLGSLQAVASVPHRLRGPLAARAQDYESELEALGAQIGSAKWRRGGVEYRHTLVQLLRLRLAPEDELLHDWVRGQLAFSSSSTGRAAICQGLARLGGAAGRHDAALVAAARSGRSYTVSPELRPLLGAGSAAVDGVIQAEWTRAKTNTSRCILVTMVQEYQPGRARKLLRAALRDRKGVEPDAALGGLRAMRADLGDGREVLRALEDPRVEVRKAAARWCAVAPRLPQPVRAALQASQAHENRLMRCAATAALVAHGVEVQRGGALLLREADAAANEWERVEIVHYCLQLPGQLQDQWPILREHVREVGMTADSGGNALIAWLAPGAQRPERSLFDRWFLDY